MSRDVLLSGYVVDEKRLRPVMAADSSFLIPAIDPGNTEPGAPYCRELIRVIEELESIDIIVPYPVLAERLLSGKDGMRSIAALEFVPFEMASAEILSKIGKSAMLMKAGSNSERRRLKYDAMIVATAQAHNASCIISLDSDVAKISKAVGLECFSWEHFFVRETAQGVLPFAP